jgi:hypothetical protein
MYMQQRVVSKESYLNNILTSICPPLSSIERPSPAESAPPMVKTEKAIDTGKSETEKNMAIDGDEVEGSSVSPSAEASETKPKDALLEKGLDVEGESQIQTTVDAADTTGEATTSELSDGKKGEVTPKEEASVANVVTEEMSAPPDDEISAHTVATAHKDLEQPSASVVEEHPAEAKETEEPPVEGTSPDASMSTGALETENQDGESIVTRPIETDVAAVEIDAVVVNNDVKEDVESPVIKDDALPATDEEEDAVATGPIEIQYEEESTLTGPKETQVMADAPVINVEVDNSESESAAKQPDLVESSVESAVASSATSLIENDETPQVMADAPVISVEKEIDNSKSESASKQPNLVQSSVESAVTSSTTNLIENDETKVTADAPVISVEKEVADSESESASKQPDLVEFSVESAVTSSATSLIENDEHSGSTVVKATEAQSHIAKEQVLGETEIKIESNEVKLASVVAEEVPSVDLETGDEDGNSEDGSECDDEESLGTNGCGESIWSDDVNDTTQGVMDLKGQESFVQEDLTDHGFLEETSSSSEADRLQEIVEVPASSEADLLEGIVDVPIDEDSVSGVPVAGTDGETVTATERSVYKGRATEELRSRVVAEACQDWGVPVIAKVKTLEGIIDVPIDEDSVSAVPEGGMDGEIETITKAEADLLDATVAAALEVTACGGETPETSKDVVVGTKTDKAIEETIVTARVADAASGGSTDETATQSNSSAASDNVVKCIDDVAVVDVTTCVPIAEKEDTDSDDDEEESGFEMPKYDYEEEETMVELDSSAESDSEEDSGSDDDKSVPAAEDDEDDDPILELKNVTAMTRVLIPEDQRHSNHMPTPSRWGWASRLGARTNTSNSNLSFGGKQEESIAKLDPKSEPKGSPLSGSPIKDESADEKEDPTDLIGNLLKKFSDTDAENQVNDTSKLSATVSPPVITKEVPKRKPLTDIEKARMFAASILLESEEKAPTKAVSKSGFSWLKR